MFHELPVELIELRKYDLCMHFFNILLNVLRDGCHMCIIIA